MRKESLNRKKSIDCRYGNHLIISCHVYTWNTPHVTNFAEVLKDFFSTSSVASVPLRLREQLPHHFLKGLKKFKQHLAMFIPELLLSSPKSNSDFRTAQIPFFFKLTPLL